MAKAIGYVRVSTEDQAREGVSLATQKEKIEAYCKLKDLDLIGVIEDAGISAKNLKRPGVREVLEMAREKRIDAIVVLKLDRMFRSTVDALESTRKFEKWGVAFHSIQETLDTHSAMGKFFFTLIAAIAEMERGIIGERTKMALGYKKARGERVGHIPFGYRLSKNGIHLKKEKHEQWILREINILRDQGLSLRRIADGLNSREITNRNNNLWNHMSIKRVASL